MKKIIVTLVLILVSVLRINAQVTEITPAQADGKSASVPIRASKTSMNVYASYSFSQSIYLASDIGSSGKITKLSYFVDSDIDLNNTWKHWKVKLGHIDEAEFESVSTSSYSPDRYVSYMNIVEVFDGNIEYDKPTKKVTINFTQPFQYDGIRNLLVEVVDKSADAYSEDIYFKTKTYSSKVMSINAADSEDYKWSYYDTAKKPTNVPVVKITIDTSVKDTPTEVSEIKVNTSELYCGSSTTSDAPVSYSDYDGDNSWVTMLYKAKKIGASGKINRIAFFPSCRVSGSCEFSEAKNQKIYMKEVDHSTHTNTSEPDLSTYTLVYNGSVTWKSGVTIEDSESVITLDTPFEYSGDKTLAIYYLNENGGELDGSILGPCSKFPYFLWDSEADTVLSENFGPFTHSDGSTGNNNKKGSGELDNVLPVLRFYFGDMIIKDNFDVGKVKLVTSLNEVKADGVASSVISVILSNPKGNHINYDDQNIKLTTTLGKLGDGFVDKNGNYSFHIISDEKGVAEITGTVDTKEIGSSVEVKFTNETKPNPDPIGGGGLITSKLIINEGFSPNGDGKNDTWVLTPDVLTKYPNNSVKIFNRHGNLVYRAAPYSNEWDGTSNGKIIISKEQKLPVGAYYFIFDTGKNLTQDGWIYINY